MFADTPSVVPFTFAIYDLSGCCVGPLWERFVHYSDDETPDLDDLLAQAELLLDCVARIDNYKTHTKPVWSSGFYITHTIPEWGTAKKPAVLRAAPAAAPGSAPAGGGGSPDSSLPEPA